MDLHIAPAVCAAETLRRLVRKHLRPDDLSILSLALPEIK
jgi:hypothetical protein